PLPDRARHTDLAQLFDDDLRVTAKHFDAPGDAEPLAPILHLRLVKFRAVTTPDHRREDLVRIGCTQIEKGGGPFDPRRKSRTRHYVAHRGHLLHMIFGLWRREYCGLGPSRRQEPGQNTHPVEERAPPAVSTIHCCPFRYRTACLLSIQELRGFCVV